MNNPKFVFDTNTLISAALLDGSTNARALDEAFKVGEVIISEATFSEFSQVLFRKKFDRYLTNERRFQIINKIKRDAMMQVCVTKVDVCRDPDDNKYIGLAIDAGAICIVTGDKDLLILHPFNNINILTAAEFLKMAF
jgi:putative PIN family toxin of toxin-antitoxin system